MNEQLKNRGWDQMREMLDKEMPVKKRPLAFFPIRIAAAITLLLALSGTLYLGTQHIGKSDVAASDPHAEGQNLLDEKTSGDLMAELWGNPLALPPFQFSEKDLAESHVSSESNELKTNHSHSNYPTTIDHQDSDHSTARIANTNKIQSKNKIDRQFKGSILEVNSPLEYGTQMTANETNKHTVSFLPLPPLMPLKSQFQSLSFSNEFSSLQSSPSEKSGDRKFPSYFASLSWVFPTNTELLGMGLNAGVEFPFDQWQLQVGLSVKQFGLFNNTPDYAVMEALNNPGSPSSVFDFMDPSELYQTEEGHKFMNSLERYTEVGASVVAYYPITQQLRIGLQLEGVYLPFHQFNLDPEWNRLEDNEGVSFALRTNSILNGEIINDFRLIGGVNLNYQFKSKFGVHLSYQKNLSKFWKDYPGNTGSMISAGVGMVF